MRKILLLLMLPVTLSCYLFGQGKEVAIQLPGNEKILQIDDSGKYLAIRTEDNSYLQNSKGELLHTFLKENEFQNCLASFINPQKDKWFTVFTEGEEQIDKVKMICLDAKSGNELWRINNLNGCKHTFSPSGKYLLATCSEHSSKSIEQPRIVEVETGREHNINFMGVYNAQWLDEDNLIITTNETQRNPEAIDLAEKIKNKEDQIFWYKEKILRLEYLLLENKITKQDFDFKVANINKEMLPHKTEANNLQKVLDRTYKRLQKTLRVVKYNWKNEAIQFEKEIYSKDSGKEIFSVYSNTIGNLLVNEKHIFIKYRDIDLLSGYLCLDKNFEVLWQRKFSEPVKCNPFISNGEYVIQGSNNTNEIILNDPVRGIIKSRVSFDKKIKYNKIYNAPKNFNKSQIKINKNSVYKTQEEKL